jgi:hypothetical protein
MPPTLRDECRHGQSSLPRASRNFHGFAPAAILDAGASPQAADWFAQLILWSPPDPEAVGAQLAVVLRQQQAARLAKAGKVSGTDYR